MILSLNGRVLIAATTSLAAFMGLTGLALDRAFQRSAVTGVENQLQGQLFGLLAAADLDRDRRLAFPRALPETRFSRVGSGLYARVSDATGREVWRSDSLVGSDWHAAGGLAPADNEFLRVTMSGGESAFLYRAGVAWDQAGGEPVPFTFEIAQDTSEFGRQVESFRRTLWLWLGGSAVLLLGVQGVVLGWGLAPLRRVAAEITRIESAEKDYLSRDYPRELRRLTDNINALLANERRQRERYRDTLGDLAHSLKTPLSVLRAAVDSSRRGDVRLDEIATQIERMREIVEYQLQRAATAGRATMAQPVAVQPQIAKVMDALAKVYAGKGVTTGIRVEEGLCFFGDVGDLLEVLGNLLDNAFKACRARVEIAAEAVTAAQLRRPGLRLQVADDGPGIDPASVDMLLRRGVRADNRAEGQGIGLAVVRDVVDAYGGQMEFNRGELGGASVVVRFPPS